MDARRGLATHRSARREGVRQVTASAGEAGRWTRLEPSTRMEARLDEVSGDGGEAATKASL